MKLINQSAELWKQGCTIKDIYDHIARCTRVCYQSTPLKYEENGKDFVERTVMKNKHYAMLEHGSVYLTIPREAEFDEDVLTITNNPYTKYNIYNDKIFVTTNLRVLHENNLMNMFCYLSKDNKLHPKRVTISFITNIGVSREFNRHRCHSIAEESTRFCNYSKDKFGNELTFIKPDEMDIVRVPFANPVSDDHVKFQGYPMSYEVHIKDVVAQDFIFYLRGVETLYLEMIEKGCSAQLARRILPLCTKTQVIHTAFLDDWKTFFDMRMRGTTGKPHPDAESAARLAYEEMCNAGIVI